MAVNIRKALAQWDRLGHPSARCWFDQREPYGQWCLDPVHAHRGVARRAPAVPLAGNRSLRVPTRRFVAGERRQLRQRLLPVPAEHLEVPWASWRPGRGFLLHPIHGGPPPGRS